MKRLLLFFTVVAVLSSCSKSQDELKLEAFKNNLDNPSSFEFVEWGDVYSNIQLRHQNEIEKRIKQLEEKQNSCYSKIEGCWLPAQVRSERSGQHCSQD